MDVGHEAWRDGASVEAHTLVDVNRILDRSSLLHGDGRMMVLPTWVARSVGIMATWEIAAVMIILLVLEKRNWTTRPTAACKPRPRSTQLNSSSSSAVFSTTYISMKLTFEIQSQNGTTNRNIHNLDVVRLALVRQLDFLLRVS